MRLLSIELENFRPFGGKQKIAFAQEPGHNVTLIYGTNGGGKTTLLNAFTWAMYESLSDDVEHQDRMINHDVWQKTPEGVEVPMSVTLEFEHEGRVYTVCRSLTTRKEGPEQMLPRPVLTVRKRGEDGVSKDVQSPQAYLDKILPERLSKFFFVNGERIEHLVRREAYTEIQHAIKTLLGLEQLARAVKHLPTASAKLRRQLKAEGEEAGLTEQLNAEIDEIDARIEQADERKTSLASEIVHLQDEIEILNERLRSLDGAKQLQEEYDRLGEIAEREQESVRRHESERAKVISSSGFLAFIADVPEMITEACDALRERGELPAPLKKTFIEDLLKQGNCICGSHLAEGSPQRAAIEEWRARAGLAEVEAAWNQLRGAVGQLDERRIGTLDALAAADKAIGEAAEEKRRAEEQQNDIRIQLQKLPQEDVRMVVARRDETLTTLGELNHELGGIDESLSRLVQEKREKSAKLDKIRITDLNSKRIQERRAVISETEEALRKILEFLSENIRKRLDTRIQEIFRGASLKNYEPRLTEDFQLEYGEKHGGVLHPAPKSTGENMLLSLSFVAAVAHQCREAADNQGIFSGVGGDYPVVMDAAFGNLDDDYRRKIAEFLPEMTSQVVVMSSKAQADGVAEESLRPRVGRQYVITTHTTKKDLAEVTEKINLEGRDYDYQVIGSSFTGAEITEVKR